jgi:hypothetical protein
MVMVRDGLLIFNSVHKVMQAEGLLKRAGLNVRIMPVPRSLSSDCGLAMAFLLSERDCVQQVLDEAGCPAAEVYRQENDQYIRLS